MPDPSDDLFRNDDAEVDGDDGALPKGDPSTSLTDPKSSDKRINDLQSKADKETARANKAEARLAALLEVAKSGDPEGSKPSEGGNASDALLDMAKMFAIQQNPKLSEYGITMAELSGSSPREVARNAAEQVARFEKLETQIRNKVLAANGLAPDIAGGESPAVTRDYSKLSSEDFKKVMEAAMRG